jgi:recombination protein RecA
MASKEGNVGKGLASVLDKLNKVYGDNAVAPMKDLGDRTIKTFSSGSLLIDGALGGGFAVGRFIELYGPFSSGKTSISLHAIAECQKIGGTAAFVDAEHAFDPSYAQAIGVDTDSLIFTQPSNGEEAVEIIDALSKSGEVDLIVVDSIAAMTPRKEIEGEAGDAVVGLHARLMSQACRKIVSGAQVNNCTIIWINQLREKVGVLFGSPEVTPGGKAMGFYASQRLDIRRSGTEKDKDGNAYANGTKVNVVKNKVAPPFKVCVTQIEFGVGIVKELEILRLGVELGLIEKSGGWHSYDGVKIANGESNCVQMLKDNPDLTREIESLLNLHIHGDKKKSK